MEDGDNVEVGVAVWLEEDVDVWLEELEEGGGGWASE